MLRAIPTALLLTVGLTGLAHGQDAVPPPPPPPVPPPPPAGAPQAPPGYADHAPESRAAPSTQGHGGARPVLVTPGQAPGQPAGSVVVRVEPEPPDDHRHDGLMVRLTAGAGYMQASSNEADLTTYGGTYSFHLNVGYALFDGLTIHGDVLVFGTPNPKLRGGTGGSLASDVGVTLAGIGFGVTHYFPRNFFLTGSISFMEMSFHDDMGTFLQSDLGGGFNAFVGKEFWVADQWGIGAGIRALVAWVPFPGELNTVLHLGADLSVTFQ